MLTSIFWVPTDCKGKLGVMPRPRGNDWLEDEVAHWKTQGVSIVASALTTEEEAELALGAEEDLCDRAGIDFRSHPIQDRSVPEDPESFRAFVDALYGDLHEGRVITVHCRMGIGRAGMIGAGVLVRCGHSARSAFDLVAKSRGRPVPDTPEQRDWIARNL